MIMTRLERNRQGRKSALLRTKRAVGLVLLSFVLLSTMFILPATSITPTTESGTASLKDETVFVSLRNDGSVGAVYVVNTFAPTKDALVDYGPYSQVQNLTDERTVVVEQGRIDIAPSVGEPEVFRYQGRLDAVQLPWQFAIKYQVDGREVSADAVLGATGRLRLSLEVQPNPAGSSHFAANYTLQVVMPLLVDKVANVVSHGATELLVGNTLSLGFVVQPGESHVQVVEAEVRDFAMPRIEMSAFRAPPVRGAWRDDLEKAFSDLQTGLSSLVTGTTRLQNGLRTLDSGVLELHNSLLPLADGAMQYKEALSQAASGMEQFANGVLALHSGGEALVEADKTLLESLQPISDGFNTIGAGVTDLRTQSAPLKELAAALVASPDPAVSALAGGMLMQLSALEQLEAGLAAANNGLAQYAAGQGALAQQSETFWQGLADVAGNARALAHGAAELSTAGAVLLDGVASVPAGVETLREGTRRLPSEVGRLVDGQRTMLDGVRSAGDGLASLLGGGSDRAVQSFADSQRARARSVQFVFVVAPIEETRYIATIIPPKVQPVSLPERIASLVRRLLSLGRESRR